MGIEVAVAIIVAVVVVSAVALVVVLLRFRWLCHRPGSLVMSLGRRDRNGRMVWRLGVASMQSTQVQWHVARCIAWWPARTWQRSRLELIGRGRSDSAGTGGMYTVSCRQDGIEFDLLMSERTYAGFAAWYESAPPHIDARVL